MHLIPTDVNALAGENLRMAYYGLRAKYNTFNAKTEFIIQLPAL